MPYADREQQRRAQATWARHKARRRRELLWQKKDQPCADCGVSYPPYVMDFDHVRGEKVNKLSAMVASSSGAAISREIDKCDVVCANCYRKRTWNRRHGVFV